jgi:PKD repeat protein
VAAFTAASPRPLEITFDGSSSTDSDGTVARFDWDFGDGQTLPSGGPTPSHEYAADGTYPVTLTVTDDEGCSAARIFTGQTVTCNGGPAAIATEQVTVDTKLDGANVKAKKTQKQKGKKVVVVVEAGAAEAVEATASGKVKADGESFTLKTAKSNVAADQTAKLKLKPKKSKDGKRILDVLERKPAKATVSCSLTDAAGNQFSTSLKIKLKHG